MIAKAAVPPILRGAGLPRAAQGPANVGQGRGGLRGRPEACPLSPVLLRSDSVRGALPVFTKPGSLQEPGAARTLPHRI